MFLKSQTLFPTFIWMLLSTIWNSLYRRVVEPTKYNQTPAPDTIEYLALVDSNAKFGQLILQKSVWHGSGGTRLEPKYSIRLINGILMDESGYISNLSVTTVMFMEGSVMICPSMFWPVFVQEENRLI